MSWPLVTLASIAEVVTGNTPSKADDSFFGGDIPFVTPGELDLGFVDNAKQTLTEKGAKVSRLIPSNSVMVCCIGSLGKVGISSRPVVTNQQINSLVINEEVALPLYVYYFCKTLKNTLNDMAPKTTVAIVNKSKFSALKIPLPPLETQKQIAAVLEKADQLRKDCKLLEQELNSLAQSVFIDMFGDPVTNPKGWKSASLEQFLLNGPTNGLYKHADSYGSGVPIIRIDGFYNGKLNNINTFKRVEVTEIELNRYKIDNRGILINRVNSPQYLGKAAFIDGIIEDTVYESNMMYLTVDESSLNSRYLVSLLASQLVKSQIKNCSKDAVNQSSINQKDVKSFQILIPDIELQNRYERFLLKLDCQLQSLNKYSVELEMQFNSLMQKAFNGELNLVNAKT